MQQALLALDLPASPWLVAEGTASERHPLPSLRPARHWGAPLPVAPSGQEGSGDPACGEPASDRTAFAIGWDHARHGLVPDSKLLSDSCSLSQGWQAARSVFGRRPVPARRMVRQWLALRVQAWSEGAGFDDLQLTPNYLRQIEALHCPVTRLPLGGQGEAAPCFCRLRQDAGFGAGQLVMMSRLARDAMVQVDAAEARRRAALLMHRPAAPDARRNTQAQQDRDERMAGLDAAAWARLATLMGFACDDGPADGAPWPLFVLPPNRVRVLQARQGLQVLLTLRLAAAGWSRRARAIAQRLPHPALRHDFQLFVGALAPRLMSVDPALDALGRRWALEDAWQDPLVQRRWSVLAAQIDAAQAQSWLEELATGELGGLSGLQLVVHRPDAATEGWALRRAGREGSTGSCARPPQKRSATTRPSAS